MSLSYWFRFLSLCFASFFLVHAAATLAVRLALSSAVRFAERLNASTAARFLLAMRLLPLSVAVVSVLGLCAPSYLRFEENLVTERVGPACLALAGLGILVCMAAFDKGLRSAVSSIEFSRLCRTGGHSVRLQGKPSKLLVIPGTRPFLAQTGIFRPCIVISQSLLREFSPEELAAALTHERAHRISRDNLKRLLLAFLPDPLPSVPSLRPLEQKWVKFTERAADDYVLAAGRQRGLSLASALVRLARLGGAAHPHDGSLLPASPLGSADDFTGRVNRLLLPDSPTASIERVRMSTVLGSTTILVAFCAVAALCAATLSPVHEFLELLIH